MGHLLKLETNNDDIFILSSAFNLDAANLEIEIRLIYYNFYYNLIHYNIQPRNNN